ncbi:oxaloacetate tautomerase fahd2, mitochondrial-like [Amphiura filiformis]|uniref:oxaloacetate tautomerase fahd2, mitochondrial-like n=1 Tax=Amphiura filiformis TaxID=82378 RepID=UPI003B2204D3
MFRGALSTFHRAVTGRVPLLSPICKRNLHGKMRLVQFEEGGSVRVGVELSNGGDVVDISAADKSIPTDMRSFLEGGESAIEAAKKVVSAGSHIVKKENLKLQAPITNPEKVLCVGMNYKDHCLEQNAPIPKEPVFFNKFASSIVGPTDDIVYPGELTSELDWEVELTIVIGKTGKNIKESEAMQHVFGYTVAHDVSARDWQMKKNLKQWMLGKCMDTFCPLGPAIVTTDELSDPHKLGIRCRVNGKTVQDSSTDQLVFRSEALIAFISRFVTLKPGDIILTGTPPGVGVFLKPEPVFLKRGDVVDVEVDEIGTCTNRVV